MAVKSYDDNMNMLFCKVSVSLSCYRWEVCVSDIIKAEVTTVKDLQLEAMARRVQLSLHQLLERCNKNICRPQEHKPSEHSITGIVHHRIKIHNSCLFLTHVITNLTDFISSAQHKRRYF